MIRKKNATFLLATVFLTNSLPLGAVGFKKTPLCRSFLKEAAKTAREEGKRNREQVARISRILWLSSQEEYYGQASYRLGVLIRNHKECFAESMEQFGELLDEKDTIKHARNCSQKLLTQLLNGLETAFKNEIEKGEVMPLKPYFPNGIEVTPARVFALYQVFKLQTLLMRFRVLFFEYLTDELLFNRQMANTREWEAMGAVDHFNSSSPRVKKQFVRPIEAWTAEVPHFEELCQDIHQARTKIRPLVEFCDDYLPFLVFLKRIAPPETVTGDHRTQKWAAAHYRGKYKRVHRSVRALFTFKKELGNFREAT